jgi:hypothetical protein
MKRSYISWPKVLDHLPRKFPAGYAATGNRIFFEDLNEITFYFVDMIFAAKPPKETKRKFWRPDHRRLLIYLTKVKIILNSVKSNPLPPKKSQRNATPTDPIDLKRTDRMLCKPFPQSLARV